VTVTNTIDEPQAIQTLAEILSSKDSKAFISRLDSKDELSVEVFGNLSPDLHLPRSQPHQFVRGLPQNTTHNPRPAEKKAFFVARRRLAERHGLLPSRVRIAGRFEVSDGLLRVSSGFADLRCVIDRSTSFCQRSHPPLAKVVLKKRPAR